MTFNETMALADQKLQAILNQRLAALEARVTADLYATGAEDADDVRDVVALVVSEERCALAAWRIETLAMIRWGLEHFDELPDAPLLHP